MALLSYKRIFVMKVKLVQSLAGIAYSHNAGDIIDCNAEEAKRFIDAGIAVAISAAPKKERAVKSSKVEKAAK